MLIVDTHCHALPHWFEPVEVLLHQIQVLSEHSTVYPDGVRYLRGESGDVGE